MNIYIAKKSITNCIIVIACLPDMISPLSSQLFEEAAQVQSTSAQKLS